VLSAPANQSYDCPFLPILFPRDGCEVVRRANGRYFLRDCRSVLKRKTASSDAKIAVGVNTSYHSISPDSTSTFPKISLKRSAASTATKRLRQPFLRKSLHPHTCPRQPTILHIGLRRSKTFWIGLGFSEVQTSSFALPAKFEIQNPLASDKKFLAHKSLSKSGCCSGTKWQERGFTWLG